MDGVCLTILGIGDYRCGMPVVGSLANYFGERPLEIRFYDSDPEFLEMYDRLARVAFKFAKSPHRLLSTEDPAEALEDADRVVFQMGDRSARKYLKKVGSELSFPDSPLQFAANDLLRDITPGAKVLTLEEEALEYPVGVFRIPDWPPALPEEEKPLVLHRVNRFLRDDEPIFVLTQAYEKTPLNAWLDNPRAAEFVSKA